MNFVRYQISPPLRYYLYHSQKYLPLESILSNLAYMQPLICFLLLELYVIEILYKGNDSILFFNMHSFMQNNTFEIHSCCYLGQLLVTFLLLRYVPLYGNNTFIFSSDERYFSYLQFLAITNKLAMNIYVQYFV